MKKLTWMRAVLILALLGCFGGLMAVDPTVVSGVQDELRARYGDSQRLRIERGVAGAAAFWRAEDGSDADFRAFCLENYAGDPQAYAALRGRLEGACESLFGHLNKLGLELKSPMQLDIGPMQPIDLLLGQFEPSAHLTEDLFSSKIAFHALLNFPHYSLAEKTELGAGWTAEQWADARLGDLFTSRVPAAVYQGIATAMTNAEAYISDYNILMDKLVDAAGKSLFPAGLKLITHWGLRDELKGRYADPAGKAPGLARQRAIAAVMNRIVAQEIPQRVINRGDVTWDPVSNKVTENGRVVVAPAEPDTRYAHFLSVFQALRALDPFYPALPSHVARKFELDREIPEAEIEGIFTRLCASPEVRLTARLIRRRLGRKLEPFDIWYNGFQGKGGISEAELDKIVAARYPTVAAFQADIPRILTVLGFSPEQVAFIAPKIVVDPSRGAGHAAGASMRSEMAHLRTRVPPGGMNYKGYNIAVHELGHCVEQTLTLQKVPHYMMNGVPNTAFTEAFAFVFQNRDLELLGCRKADPQAASLLALDTLWSAYEIMGVAMVDMKSWNWLYGHPAATPAELKAAVTGIAREIWNKYYADVFGVRDQTILAIYSHMIESALYLPDYPMGHLIQFQIEKQLVGKSIGAEMERMCVAGRIVPQLWMKNAVGSVVSEKPLLEAAAAALKVIGK